MTIDQLISELEKVKAVLGGDAIVCEDEGDASPGGPINGLQGQVDIMPGEEKARKCVVLLGNWSRLLGAKGFGDREFSNDRKGSTIEP